MCHIRGITISKEIVVSNRWMLQKDIQEKMQKIANDHGATWRLDAWLLFDKIVVVHNK